MKPMTWYAKTALWYAGVWITGLLLSMAGVTVFIHTNYVRYTSAEAWQHSRERWGVVVLIAVFIAAAQLPGILMSVASARRLRRERPANGGILWYLWGLATVCYLLWTLTLAMGLWALPLAPFFAGLFAVLAAAGAIVWGIVRLVNR